MLPAVSPKRTKIQPLSQNPKIHPQNKYLIRNRFTDKNTIRLIGCLSEGTPKKINILAQSLTTFIPENMKSSSIELIETWFKGTDEQIEAIGENSPSLFTRDMREIGMHIDIEPVAY